MENLEWFKIITGVVTLMGSIIAIFKTAGTVKDHRRNMLRADYDFLRNHIDLINGNPPPHDIVVEHGFLAFTGYKVSAAEIRFLLEQEFPLKTLKSYAQARDFIELNSEEGRLQFKNSFNRPEERRRFLGWRLFFYFVCAFFALAPIALFPLIGERFGLLNSFVMIVLLASIFSLPAWIFLSEYFSLKQSESLIENQAAESSNQSSQENSA